MVPSAILTYHSLDDTGSVISVHPRLFRDQMEALASSGLKVVPLTELLQQPNAVAITFDDGFANFAEQAVPVLERRSLPATVFVIAGYCGKRNNWPTQPPGFPELPLMSWSALRDLPPLVALGGHTMTHPDLCMLDDSAMREEILKSRSEIEQQTGRRVETFAYPYGAVDDRAAALVRREFRVGCGTRLKFIDRDADVALLPRLDTYYLQSADWVSRLFGISTRAYIGARRLLREARSAVYVAKNATAAAKTPSQ